jgi:hypothetical protein
MIRAVGNFKSSTKFGNMLFGKWWKIACLLFYNMQIFIPFAKCIGSVIFLDMHIKQRQLFYITGISFSSLEIKCLKKRPCLP